jgi:hypothetical protein
MRSALKLMAVLALVSVCAGFLLIRLTTGRPESPSFSAQAAPTGAPLVEEIRDYRKWTKVNPQPVNMDMAVAQLCAAPRGARSADKNPHLNKFITVYVNEKGRRAMMEEREPLFPVGSVIVKEKLAAKDAASPELLTVMIKRGRGFNPQSGDWEYLVTSGAGTEVEARGRLQSCQACHEMHKGTDYVSRIYLPDEVRRALR